MAELYLNLAECQANVGGANLANALALSLIHISTPLILLDDVEISVSDLNYVPAENIESFSILKDASATAIYGARGANGCLLYTSGVQNGKKVRVKYTVPVVFRLQ